jgi:hypothetical protein
MMQVPMNANGIGPPALQPLQALTTGNQAEPNEVPQAAQPETPSQEIAAPQSRPVQEAAHSEVVDQRIGRTEITSQTVELRLTKAAEEFSQARAQAARITGEMQAQGLIPSNSAAHEKAENAFAQTRAIESAAVNSTTSRIV